MLFRKLKEGDRYRLAKGPRALTASSGFVPWSMAGELDFGSVKEKSNHSIGIKGACPFGLPPSLGREGADPRNFHASSKN